MQSSVTGLVQLLNIRALVAKFAKVFPVHSCFVGSYRSISPCTCCSRLRKPVSALLLFPSSLEHFAQEKSFQIGRIREETLFASPFPLTLPIQRCSQSNHHRQRLPQQERRNPGTQISQLQLLPSRTTLSPQSPSQSSGKRSNSSRILVRETSWWSMSGEQTLRCVRLIS